MTYFLRLIKTRLVLCCALFLLAACAADTPQSVDAGTNDAATGIDATSADADVDADVDASTVDTETEWTDMTMSVVATGNAMSPGNALPVYPFGIWAGEDQIVIVGEARSDLVWGDVTLQSGAGFILALDPSTGEPQWARTVGEDVSGVAAHGDDLVVVGSFSGESTFEPATEGPIVLQARGTGAAIGAPTDGFVGVITHEGTFRWVQRYGSDSFDEAFSVASDGETIVVAGALGGPSDVGEECPATLGTFAGGVDPEGHAFGVDDSIVLEYASEGGCPWAAVVGAPRTDDAANGIAIDEHAIYLTGTSGMPMRMLTTDSTDVSLGGPVSTGSGAFLTRIERDGRAASTWFAPGEGRGGAVRQNGADVLWLIETADDTQIEHNDIPLQDAPQGMSLLVVRDDAIVRNVFLGRNLFYGRSIAVADEAIVVPLQGSEESNTVLARLDAMSFRTMRSRSAPSSYPLVASAFGENVWIAGWTGSEFSLGNPTLDVTVGPQGSMFLLKLMP